MKKKNAELKLVDGEKLKVEKGIKKTRRQSGANHPYPFENMGIGDSFLVPKDTRVASSVRAHVYYCLKSFNINGAISIKISTQFLDEGMRVWRDK